LFDNLFKKGFLRGKQTIIATIVNGEISTDILAMIYFSMLLK